MLHTACYIQSYNTYIQHCRYIQCDACRYNSVDKTTPTVMAVGITVYGRRYIYTVMSTALYRGCQYTSILVLSTLPAPTYSSGRSWTDSCPGALRTVSHLEHIGTERSGLFIKLSGGGWYRHCTRRRLFSSSPRPTVLPCNTVISGRFKGGHSAAPSL